MSHEEGAQNHDWLSRTRLCQCIWSLRQRRVLHGGNIIAWQEARSGDENTSTAGVGAIWIVSQGPLRQEGNALTGPSASQSPPIHLQRTWNSTQSPASLKKTAVDGVSRKKAETGGTNGAASWSSQVKSTKLPFFVNENRVSYKAQPSVVLLQPSFDWVGKKPCVHFDFADCHWYLWMFQVLLKWKGTG